MEITNSNFKHRVLRNVSVKYLQSSEKYLWLLCDQLLLEESQTSFQTVLRNQIFRWSDPHSIISTRYNGGHESSI